MRCWRIPPFRKKESKPIERNSPTEKAPQLHALSDSGSSVTLRQRFQFVKAHEMEAIPESQQQLQLNAPKEAFTLTADIPLPEQKRDEEVLIEVRAVGLNPIDWKGPAFGFGLPSFPCVLGRDLVGTIVRPPRHKSKFQTGDMVLAVSTDYRDYRKAAFQEYAVATEFNVCRIPEGTSLEVTASVGVAFVSAALILGVCLGAKPVSASDGVPTPDLFQIARDIPRENLPDDIREECLEALDEAERIGPGDWLAIWGASSTVGFVLLQLAKRIGVKVICIADAVKHGERLVQAGADVLVHRANLEEAVAITKSVTGNRLKYAVDTVGKDTAELLQSALAPYDNGDKGGQRHLVGLTGVPKDSGPGIVKHQVPVKLFHESPRAGEAIMDWLEQLLLAGSLTLPKVDIAEAGGLEGINPALERLKSGSLAAQRIVVPI